MNNELRELLKSVIDEALQPITKEVQELKGQVQGIKSDVQALKGEVQGIKSDVQALKGEVQGMKEEIVEVKQAQLETNERLTKIELKQNIIYEQTGKLSEYHDETASSLEQLATKEDIDYFDKKVSQHEREIFKLKNRA